jgi:DNA modification methylase
MAHGEGDLNHRNLWGAGPSQADALDSAKSHKGVVLTDWPADKVERWPLERLVPYARNARTHSDAQVAQIAASVREWGWTTPVLVDEAGGIIAGHGRVLAARQLGIADVPVMVARGWTEAQRKAYTIADNKLALNGGWDIDLLRLEAADLDGMGFNLDLLGFGDEMAAIRAQGGAGLTDPDEAPELPVNPVAMHGDLWALGRHRLLCGDATNAEDAQKLLGAVKPHLMVTDPPYGVNYDPAAARRTSVNSARGKVTNDDRADWREAWKLFPGDVAYVWHGMLHAGTVFESLIEAGFTIRAEIVWAKSQLVMSRGHYHPQHESCWYAVRQQANGHWRGDRTQTTLWQIDKPRKSETGHSTQKPVECMKRPIENNSSPGQAVYDPFVGSGTTIIAAEMIGRLCHAIEIDPAYIDVCINRWQDFTGQEATLDGKSFAQVKAERHKEAA